MISYLMWTDIDSDTCFGFCRGPLRSTYFTFTPFQLVFCRTINILIKVIKTELHKRNTKLIKCLIAY